MLKNKITIFLLFLCLISKATDTSDSLRVLLDGSTLQDSARIKTHLLLANQLQKTNIDAAILESKEALRIAKANNLHLLTAKCLNQIGLIYYYEGQLEVCKEYFTESQEYFENANNLKGKANTINNVGVILYEQGYFSEALSNFIKSLEMRRQLNDSMAISASLNNIGNVHKDLKEFDIAIDYYQKSIVLKDILSDKHGLAMTYNNIGQIYFEKEDYERALIEYDKSVVIKKEIEDKHGLSMTYSNIGSVYMMQKKYSESKKIFQNALKIKNEILDEYGALQINLNIGELHVLENNLKEAETISLQNLTKAKQLNAQVQIKDALHTLFKVYEQSNQYEKALEYYKHYASLNDSILFNQKLEAAKKIETELHVKEKEKEIKILKLEAVESIDFWKQDWFSITMFFLLIGGVLFLINNSAKYKESLAAETKYVNQAKSTRLIYILAAFLYPLIGYIYSLKLTLHHDPISLRLTISSLLIALYIAKPLIKRLKENIEKITLVLYFILTTHMMFLVYLNDIHYAYILQLVGIIAAISAIIKNLKITVIYLLYVLTLSILILLFCENPQTPPTIFIASIASLSVISVIVLLSKIATNKQLNFSNNIVNEIDALVMVIDKDGNTVFVSESSKEILGYSPKEVMAPNWYKSVGFVDEDLKIVKSNLAQLASGEKMPSDNNVKLYKTKTGELKWILWKDKRVQGDLLLGIGYDVTDKKLTEDLLQQSEANFKQISKTISDVFYLYNITEKKYEFISENCVDVLGADQEFFYSGKSHTTLHVYEEDKPKLKAVKNKVENGEEYEIEFRVIVNNKVRWIMEKSFPIKNENDQVVKNSGICTDITTHKLAEDKAKLLLEEIQLKEDTLRKITDSQQSVLWLTDWETGSIDYLSPSYEKVFERSAASLMGNAESWTQDIHPDDRDRVTESFKHDVPKGVYDIEYRLNSKSGKLKWIRERAFPVKPVNGIFGKVSGLSEDITASKLQELELEKLSLVASSTSNYVLISNVKTGIEWINDAFVKQFGFTFEEVENKFPSEVIHNKQNKDKSILEEVNDIVFNQKQQFSGELEHVTKSGEVIQANVNITPIIDLNGVVEKYFVIGSDITEIKTISRQLAIINSIENTILTADSTEKIIYNTLRKSLGTLPISRASLALFNFEDEKFQSYAVTHNDEKSNTDKKIFDLKDFSRLPELQDKKTHIIYNINSTSILSKTDKILAEEGNMLAIMSPLYVRNELIGSFNVCFNHDEQKGISNYVKITNEVAKGLAVALQQSRLKDEIHASHKEILGSLEYALKIQETILPDILAINDYFNDSFIIYHPKETVSGDFYWFNRSTKNSDEAVFGVIDCTGHGVPGAFVSLIGNQYLTNTVENHITQPSKILQSLNEGVYNAMHKNKLTLNDGMDVVLCKYNSSTKMLTYAGAVNSLFILRNNEIIELKGDLWSIGQNVDGFEYSQQEFKLETNDVVYMTSDGYQDQFGGPNDKKIMKKKLLKLFTEYSNLPLDQQRDKLETYLNEWKGKDDQTDDITVFAFRA